MVSIVLVDDREIIKLNRRWFKKRRPTDVITFPFPVGEVYISIDTARRQARERGITLWHELLRLAVHGMLHVAGYDDTNLKDFCRMREKEWEMLVRTV